MTGKCFCLSRAISSFGPNHDTMIFHTIYWSTRDNYVLYGMKYFFLDFQQIYDYMFKKIMNQFWDFFC